jgi:prephenate dehydratase
MAKVAFQGVKGAFSEDAVAIFFSDAETLPQPDFESVFRAVERGRRTTAWYRWRTPWKVRSRS